MGQPQAVLCPVVVIQADREQIRTDTDVEELRAQWSGMVEQIQAQNVIIDVSGVKFLNTPGLRPFISLNKDLAKRDGRLVLSGLQENVKSMMQATFLLSTRGATPVKQQFLDAADVPSAVKLLYSDVT